MRNILLMGLGEFPRGWGAGILLVTRLVMVSRPAGKSAGNSQLHVTVGSRVNDDFPAVPRVPMAGITIDTRISIEVGDCYFHGASRL